VKPADRAIGSFLGLAIGDALGAPLEFSDPGDAAKVVACGLDMTGGGIWEAGEWTDDTAMALHLAESIGERGLIDLDDVAVRYADWVASGPKDVGLTTRAALTRVTCASDAREQARVLHEHTGRTAGNGTVMRAAPIAFAASSLENACAAARADAELTHFDPAAGDASASLCAALVAVVEGGDPLAAARAAATDSRTHAALADVGDAEAIRERAGGPEFGVAWTALAAGLHAVTEFDGFADGIAFTISLGRDTDTNAAVAGALLGAQHGSAGLPEPWVARLKDRDRIERAARAASASTSRRRVDGEIR
jgi:ADP-ribosylglycohydrolase